MNLAKILTIETCFYVLAVSYGFSRYMDHNRYLSPEDLAAVTGIIACGRVLPTDKIDNLPVLQRKVIPDGNDPENKKDL